MGFLLVVVVGFVLFVLLLFVVEKPLRFFQRPEAPATQCMGSSSLLAPRENFPSTPLQLNIPSLDSSIDS